MILAPRLLRPICACLSVVFPRLLRILAGAAVILVAVRFLFTVVVLDGNQYLIGMMLTMSVSIFANKGYTCIPIHPSIKYFVIGTASHLAGASVWILNPKLDLNSYGGYYGLIYLILGFSVHPLVYTRQPGFIGLIKYLAPGIMFMLVQLCHLLVSLSCLLLANRRNLSYLTDPTAASSWEHSTVLSTFVTVAINGFSFPVVKYAAVWLSKRAVAVWNTPSAATSRKMEVAMNTVESTIWEVVGYLIVFRSPSEMLFYLTLLGNLSFHFVERIVLSYILRRNLRRKVFLDEEKGADVSKSVIASKDFLDPSKSISNDPTVLKVDLSVDQDCYCDQKTNEVQQDRTGMSSVLNTADEPDSQNTSFKKSNDTVNHSEVKAEDHCIFPQNTQFECEEKVERRQSSVVKDDAISSQIHKVERELKRNTISRRHSAQLEQCQGSIVETDEIGGQLNSKKDTVLKRRTMLRRLSWKRDGHDSIYDKNDVTQKVIQLYHERRNTIELSTNTEGIAMMVIQNSPSISDNDRHSSARQSASIASISKENGCEPFSGMARVTPRATRRHSMRSISGFTSHSQARHPDGLSIPIEDGEDFEGKMQDVSSVINSSETNATPLILTTSTLDKNEDIAEIGGSLQHDAPKLTTSMEDHLVRVEDKILNIRHTDKTTSQPRELQASCQPSPQASHSLEEFIPISPSTKYGCVRIALMTANWASLLVAALLICTFVTFQDSATYYFRVPLVTLAIRLLTSSIALTAFDACSVYIEQSILEFDFSDSAKECKSCVPPLAIYYYFWMVMACTSGPLIMADTGLFYYSPTYAAGRRRWM
ncbi:hypothetical protein BC829DRAFT_385631 [Chytridium lagenaria]|nr:hypothetical protein BC829DRAFT_385631 [Chytridium lagenaria]